MSKPPERLYFTVDEAAPLMRMGRSTLYRLVKERRVHYSLDPAGRIRFTQSDIDANVDAGRRPAVAA